MRLLVVAPEAPEFQVSTDRPFTRDDRFDDARQAELASWARPAVEQYAGRLHLRFRLALERLRAVLGREAVDVAFVSSAFGLLGEDAPIPPYAGSFAAIGRAGLPDWAKEHRIQETLAVWMRAYDAVVFLVADEALRGLMPLPAVPEQTRVFFLGKGDRRLVEGKPRHVVAYTGQDEATAHGVKTLELRGHLFDLLVEAVEAQGETLFDAIAESKETLAACLAPRFPVPADMSVFSPPERKPRVRFFIPECDDRVDPGYDFLNDEPSLMRKSDLDDAFAHDPAVYGAFNYDGILVSKNQVEERPFKRQYIEDVGIHAYLRVPKTFPVMGDCGAFTYVGEERPPYRTDEILRYYERIGFDYGVSIDHLIIPPVYMRATSHVVRLDGTRIDLEKDQLGRVGAARTTEPKVAALEETVMYLPEEGLVVIERKALGGVARPSEWPAAYAGVCASGHTPPFTTSRLARVRTISYYRAHITLDGVGTRRFFARMAALTAEGAIEAGHFEPITRAEYEALMQRRARRDLVGETLRQDRWVYYPESEDATLERVQADLREIRFRFLLTIRNGRDFIRRHRRAGHRFTPIGAVQGWHGPLFRYAISEFLRMGYDFVALGGVAMARTEEILEVLRAIQPALAERPDVELHLFGVARNDQVESFIRLGVTSFDSTGPLRKAWLNATANYLTADGPAYAALRIPDPHSSPKAKGAIDPAAGVTVKRLLELEREALGLLRAYDRGEAGLEETLDAIMAYDELLGEDRDKFRPLFRRTLEERPWKHCPCAICRDVGVDVVIFRGNDRNRRRGFHNTWVFYQELQRIRLALENAESEETIERAVPESKGVFVQLAFEL